MKSNTKPEGGSPLSGPSQFMEILVHEPIDLEMMADLCFTGIKRGPPSKQNHNAWRVTGLLESAGTKKPSTRKESPPSILSLGRIWESAVDCYLTRYAVDRGGVYLPDVELEKGGIASRLDGLMMIPEQGIMVCEAALRFSMSDEIPTKSLQRVQAHCCLAETDKVCYVSGHISSRPPEAKGILRILQLPHHSIAVRWQGLQYTKRCMETQADPPKKAQ